MNWKNSNDRYAPLLIAVHWLMAVLMVTVYASIELRELFPKGSDPRDALKALHFMLGLSVLVLVLPRLLLRLSKPTPVITPEPPAWQQSAAYLVHIALYLLMMITPLLGWLLLSAAGKSIPFFGLQWPALVDENKNLAELFKETHETFGEIGYYLIGLHIVSAIYHHHVQHDNTLTRMLPLPKNASQDAE